MFCRIIFKKALFLNKHWVLDNHTICLLVVVYLFIIQVAFEAAYSSACLLLMLLQMRERTWQRQAKGEPVHIQEGCQEGIHINLEKVTQFSYLSGSSAALKRKCLQHRGIDRSQLLILFVCLFAEKLVLTILYDRCKQRSILGKAKIPSVYYAQISNFTTLLQFGGVGWGLLRYYRNQGKGELSHK